MVGELIGRYRLRERIGEGGMGVVYLAAREGDFHQRVALKLVRRGVGNPELARRFAIERQTLAALSHPNIVRLIDGGVTGDGLSYLVMDYVEGTRIDRYCDIRKLPVAARLSLFLRVCDAVAYAHRSLVVHCDLKAGNILVTEGGEPMLLDFGIAKLLDPEAMGVRAQDAVTGQRAFTPESASPEQLRWEAVTTSTDVYALGVILYQLLTGHTPHEAAASLAMAEWVRSVCEADAEPPSRAVMRTTGTLTPEEAGAARGDDPERLRRRLEGDLDAIVLTALRKEPRERYGSVEQLAGDIRRHLENQPVLARRNSGSYVARKFLRRHKLAASAGAAVAAALAIGAGVALWQARVAAARFNDVRQLAHAFLFDVHDSIQDLPGSTPARSAIARTGAEYLDRLAGGARGEAGLALEVAEGYLKLGDVQGNPFTANLGDSTAALASYRKALALVEPVASRRPRDLKARRLLAQAHESIGSLLPFTGKALEGLEHLDRAVTGYAAVSAGEPANIEAKLDLARAQETRGDVLGGPQGIQLGRTQEAGAAYEKSLALIPIVPLGHPSELRAARARAVVIMKTGDMASKRGDNAAALAAYSLALRTGAELMRADPNNMRSRGLVSALWNKTAWTQADQGDHASAAASYRKALELNEESLKADPANERARSNVVSTEKNLGDLYFHALGNMPEALRCYRRAAGLLEAQCQADPRNLAWRQRLSEALTYVASAMLRTGEGAEARRHAQRGLDLARELADRPEATLEQVSNYAWLAITIEPADLRQPASALPYAQKAVKMGAASDPMALHVLAQALAGTGDFRQAVAAEEKALSLLPAAAPGTPAPARRAAIERALADYRKALP